MLKLIKTLLKPDREDGDPASAEVAQAANILQIGEFQLLQLAYEEWYGEPIPDAETNRLFADYMLRRQVPHWARHYARRIIVKDELGDLDDGNPAYHRYDSEYYKALPLGARRLALAVCCLVFVMGGVLFVGHVAPISVTSVLPPYFTEKELTPAPVGGIRRSSDISGS